MKILHVCLANFYIDNFSYQENLLPKYHRLLGHDVEIVASLQSFDSVGRASFIKKPSQYINENGISVTRLAYKIGIWNKKLKRYRGLKNFIEKKSYDVLFIHGVQFIDFLLISRIRKSKKFLIFADNHADFTNSATNFFSKWILHRKIWRYVIKKVDSAVSLYYGVLPSRVDFLNRIYDIELKKIKYLPLGIDDFSLKDLSNLFNKEFFCKNNNLSSSKKLIVTGGKIDKSKREILDLMRYVGSLENVNLVVFGPVTPNLVNYFSKILSTSDNIIYFEWLENDDAIELFSFADLVVFPGRHSVYWEQVMGLGIPLLVKENSNVKHLKSIPEISTYISSDDLLKHLIEMLTNGNLIRVKELMKKYSYKYYYSNIAKISLRDFEKFINKNSV